MAATRMAATRRGAVERVEINSGISVELKQLVEKTCWAVKRVEFNSEI